MAESEEAPDYGLVMPFVVCASQGGTLDDQAFVAGAAWGQHDAELRAVQGVMLWTATVIPEMVPQYDLLAMHHGFVMESEAWEGAPDEWVIVTFRRPTTDGDIGGQP